MLTIGQWSGPSQPTVSLSNLTITGGLTTTIPPSEAFMAVAGLQAFGGGIQIPYSSGYGPGATVTIANSVVSGNTAASTATYAPAEFQDFPGWPACPGPVPCEYSGSSGGGIASWGTLTLVNTTVSGNQAAGVASDADGGGVAAMAGSLTLTNSTVTHNAASAVQPNGRFAEGGGIFMGDGTTLTIANSSVSVNATLLKSVFPYFVGDGQTLDMNSNSGGIHLSDGLTATIDNSHIDLNSVTVDDPDGEPISFGSGICSCTDDQVSATLTLRNSTVSGNTLDVTVASQADVFPGSGSALELDSPGTVLNSQVLGNSSTVRAGSGDAIVSPGGVSVADASTPATIANSVIASNAATAIAPHGQAVVLGAGLVNQGPLLLQNDLITLNKGTVHGQTELAQGGGIYNGSTWSPGGPITLQNTSVIGNVLAGDVSATLQGAGLYTVGFPATLTHSLVAHNSPDQCVGASC